MKKSSVREKKNFHNFLIIFVITFHMITISQLSGHQTV